MMTASARRHVLIGTAVAALAFLPVSQSHSQGAARAPAETWYVAKSKGGVYKPPMRPLWKQADLLKMHAGQNNWSEQIVRDPEQDATYNSAAPGTRFSRRMHADTPTLFVVISGQLHFEVEGQPPVTATRGALVNIMHTTLYSYDVTGDRNALWVEVNPPNYQSVYPSAEPQPKAPAGAGIVKVSFNHTPGAYSGANKLMVNTFDDVIGKCLPRGAVVVDDHLWASPLIGYLNAADNSCGTGSGNIGDAGRAQAAFDPATIFGHFHPGPAEWWIIQSGAISGKFENTGQFHATEGDVLYAAPMTWHQMASEGPSGPSIRLALGGYNFINMNNTAGQ
jgi:mannose-6-phosphate isomerase-like protein (cupin superfamily)